MSLLKMLHTFLFMSCINSVRCRHEGAIWFWVDRFGFTLLATFVLQPFKLGFGFSCFPPQDKNLGLVNQVVSSMYKRNIQRLTQTYLTLSLQDIANTVQLRNAQEAEMHVLQMASSVYYGDYWHHFIIWPLIFKLQIQDGEIYATINQKDGMVRFLEDPEQYKTCEMIEHIDSSIQR